MDCAAFLQWALPEMAFKWSGFRKVRGQVCKRVRRRMRELGLEDFSAYQTYLQRHVDEWTRLDDCCRITISRFFRDRGVFEALAGEVLPALARAALGESRPLRVWCAGAASGEEPYSLSILWRMSLANAWPDTPLEVVATDSDPLMLARAETACYAPGSLKDLPAGWLEKAFTPQDEGQSGAWRLKPEFKTAVTRLRQDLREACPDGVFDLILCRNLAFTYFDDAAQQKAAVRIAGRLRPGGALVLGAHENLPGGELAGGAAFAPWPGARHVWRRVSKR